MPRSARRLLHTTVVLTVLGTLSVPGTAVSWSPGAPQQAQAQGGCGTLRWDFTIGYEGWWMSTDFDNGYYFSLWHNASEGTLYALGRWQGRQEQFMGSVDFGQTCRVTRVTLRWKAESTNSANETHVSLYDGPAPSTYTDWQSSYLVYRWSNDSYWNWSTTTVYEDPMGVDARVLNVYMSTTWTEAIDWVEVETYQPSDGDGDGVPDAEDACPTEGNQGSGVDASGCPNAPSNTCQDRRWEFEANTEGWTFQEAFRVVTGRTVVEGAWQGELDGAAGLTAAGYNGSTSQEEFLNAAFTFNQPCQVARVSLRWKLQSEVPDTLLRLRLLNPDGGGGYTNTAELAISGGPGTWDVYDWYPLEAASITATFAQASVLNVFYGNLEQTQAHRAIVIDWIEVDVAEPLDWQLGRPLAQSDEHSFGQYGSPVAFDFAYAVTAFSYQWGAPVHAVAEGTVESVRPVSLSSTTCAPNLFGHNGRFGHSVVLQYQAFGFSAGEVPPATCLLSHPDLPFGGVYWELDAAVSGFYGYTNLHDLYVDLAGASVVVVSSPTYGRVHYLVTQPQVVEGGAVSQGCVIGYTFGFYPERTDALQGIGGLERAEEGIAFVALYDGGGSPRSVLPYNFQVYPSNSSTPCVEGAIEAQCIDANSRLENNASGWVVEDPAGTISLPGGGLRLAGRISQALLFPPEGEYSLVVDARLEAPAPDGQPQVLKVGMGDVRPPNGPIDIQVPANGEPVHFTVPPQVWTPNSGTDQYDLYLQPGLFNTAAIVVDFVCVSDNEADPVNLPSSCAFANPRFNNASGWIASTNGLNGDPRFEEGTVTIPGGAWIEQSVTLQPGDYTFSYEGRLRPRIYEGAHSVTAEWTFSPASGGSIFDTIDWTGQADQISVEATTTASFRISATNATDPAEDELQLNEVCITPAGGPPATPVTGGQFAEECEVCSYTTSGDVAHDLRELIAWLACQVRQLWFCHAYTIAYGTWEGILNILRGIGMLGRYLAYAAQRFLLFGQDFTYYLGGHLANLGLRMSEVAGGRTVYVEGGGGATFWDVLVTLFDGLRDVLVTLLDDLLAAIQTLVAALSPVVTTLLNLVVGVLNMLTTVLNTILAQIALIPQIGASIIGAIQNSTPTPIPGAPDCSTPNLNPLCIGTYVVDNTLFRPTSPAVMLVPLVLGAASLWLIAWAVDRVRSSFLAAS